MQNRFALVLFVLIAAWGAPRQTPTPPVRSLFVEDTCAPPCWFGLIPGESTEIDAVRVIRSFDNLFYRPRAVVRESTFDSETGLMIDGAYIFHWRPEVFDNDVAFTTANVIVIHQGKVYRIDLNMNRPVNLAEALDRLGSPNYVIADNVQDQVSILGLYYFELSLEIVLVSEWDGCFANHMSTSFMVDSMAYYAPGHPLMRPQLRYTDGSERVVPPEIWQTWLNGEVERSCLDAWQQLPFSTPTPEPQ